LTLAHFTFSQREAGVMNARFAGRCLGAVLLSFAVGADLLAGPVVRFFALGDVPYTEAGLMVPETFLGQELKKRMPFLVHAGDIKSGRERCSDNRLKEVAKLFRAQPVPVVYTSGGRIAFGRLRAVTPRWSGWLRYGVSSTPIQVFSS
jgi:hypothetical protein